MSFLKSSSGAMFALELYLSYLGQVPFLIWALSLTIDSSEPLILAVREASSLSSFRWVRFPLEVARSLLVPALSRFLSFGFSFLCPSCLLVVATRWC